MNRFQSTILAVIIGSLAILLATSIQCFAATLSGKVVDESGKPVPEVVVSVQSFKGNFVPGRRNMHRQEPIFPPPQPGNTDATGAFSIDNIVSPSVNRLILLPNRDPDYEVRALEMQGIEFYFQPYQFNRDEGFPFGIEQETDIKDVKITVRLRMRIRGQVLAADGTPLSGARVNLMVKNRRKGRSGRGSTGGTATLDADGNFTRYVNSPAYYTISVTYQGQSVESKEVFLEEGQRLDGLTLTLKGNPQQPRKPDVINAVPIVDHEKRMAVWQRRQEGVWAINPTNRHAYKRINCQSPEEALAQATDQGAHLVAINDKEEQQWILDVFGKENYWIGFTDGVKKGDKQWDNGDPITYTNWDTQQLIPESDKSSEKDEKTSKNYSVLIGVTGKWQRAREGSPVAGLIEQAILEKADVIIGMPTEDEE